MIQLTEAISNRFPHGNEWADEARATLAGELDDTALVHDVAEGWMRRGTGADAELVDTLFVLTNDRLGMGRTGQAEPTAAEPRWIHLSSIRAVDAVDDSPLPLQTIEIELDNGVQLCLGWPDAFSATLVPVLVALAEGDALEEASAEAMPRELSDPSEVHDTSDLDALSPSGWVEPEVDEPDEIEAEAEAEVEAQVETDEPGTQERKVVAALDFFNPAPAPEVEPETDEPAEPGTDALWTSLDAVRDAPPLRPGAFEPGDEQEPEAFDPAGLAEWVEPLEPEPAPVAQPSGPAPWHQPGMVWPDPLRGVLYLGGHPAHPRKRKNGSMIFSPKGLDVSGTGFQNWEMSMDWAFVEAMEIQGPDEVMFGDHIKIDSTSSALVVTMVDQTRMFFEVRTRRPPSLRAALAPVLLMVENIRSHRAHG